MYWYVCECVHAATMYVDMLCYICNHVPVHIYVCMLQSCTSVCDCVQAEILSQCMYMIAACKYVPVHIIACSLDRYGQRKIITVCIFLCTHAWKHLPLTMHIIWTHLCNNTFTPRLAHS